jgi:hypothetical protein
MVHGEFESILGSVGSFDAIIEKELLMRNSTTSASQRKKDPPFESFMWEGCAACGGASISGSTWTALYRSDRQETRVSYSLCQSCQGKFTRGSQAVRARMNRDIMAFIDEIRQARSGQEVSRG